MKKNMETKMPLPSIYKAAAKEKVRPGHPGNLHPWWSRSPILSSTLLLKETLADRQYPWAKSQEPVVCDPFSGFGGLVLAAQQLGLPTFASDLNPVAVLLTKAVAEIPARFAAAPLAADVLKYGEKLEKAVQKKLSAHYPDSVFAWIWVRTMPCPNPACSCEMPLGSSFVLSQARGREYWAEPVIKEGNLQFYIHQGPCPPDKQTNKHGSRGAKFICPGCGTITQDEEVIQAGHTGKLHSRLIAVCMQTQEGRIFLAPDAGQLQAARYSGTVDAPAGEISNNPRWFSPPRFGLTKFSDLFTPRQLLLLTTFCERLPVLIKGAETDALAAGMTEDTRALKDGGSGALAYSQAIGVYLSLIISKLTDFQSNCCTWDNRTGNIRSVFNRQALPMAWVYGEGNPFAGVTGNFASLLKSTVQAVAKLPGNQEAVVQQADALQQHFPKDALLFTELPYYDHVGYAELSDYFYVWLKKCLQKIYPDLFHSLLTPKEELSSIPEQFAGNPGLAAEKYQQGLRKLFQNFYPYASETYPSVVFFNLHPKEGEMADAHFIQLLACIQAAGFKITALWPLRSEKPGKSKEAVRTAVVFCKQNETGEVTTRRGFINALKRELPGLLKAALENVLEEKDRPIVSLGMGLRVLAAFSRVLNADGTEMVLPEALPLIEQEVKMYSKAQAARQPEEE